MIACAVKHQRTDAELRHDITGWQRSIATSKRMQAFYERAVARAEGHLREQQNMVTEYKNLIRTEEAAMRGAEWELTTGHRAEEHANCTRQNCMICEGGLTYCLRCGGFEGSLLPTCPGKRLTEAEHEQNYKHYCAKTGPFEDLDLVEADTNSRVERLEHRRDLAKQKEMCGYCRPHKGENRTHTSPHADVRKSKRTRQK